MDALYVRKDGRKHRFVNAALPTHRDGVALSTCVCPDCGFAHSELYGSAEGERCSECRIEATGERERKFGLHPGKPATIREMAAMANKSSLLDLT